MPGNSLSPSKFFCLGLVRQAVTCFDRLPLSQQSRCRLSLHLWVHSRRRSISFACIVMQVDLSRVEAICKAKLKVDADTVLDPESPQALVALVRKLQSLQVTRHCCSLFLITACVSLSPMASKDLLCCSHVRGLPACFHV